VARIGAPQPKPVMFHSPVRLRGTRHSVQT